MPKLESCERQTIEFQTYQGLQKVVRSRTPIYEPLNTLLDWLDDIQYRSIDPAPDDNHQTNYEYKRSVRLLDTFLLGSMREDVLQKLIDHSVKHGFSIQILLLDPYSPLARLRSRFIENDAPSAQQIPNAKSIGHVITSLHKLLKAVDDVVPSEELISSRITLPETVQSNEPSYINEQIELLNSLRRSNLVDLEVKFYSDQTEAPVYIISRFVAKGLVFPKKKASKNPWMIFVDDKTQSDDIYDNFSTSFDSIWQDDQYSWGYPKSDKIARSILDPATPENRRVFVVHGHDEAARQTMVRYLEQLELEPIILAEQPSKGRTIIQKFEENADVGYAVVLLTPDDIGYAREQAERPQPRARQNVILELGYFIGQLSGARVCALRKGSTELPSDYHGVVFLNMDDGGGWKLELAREIRSAGFDINLNLVS